MLVTLGTTGRFPLLFLLPGVRWGATDIQYTGIDLINYNGQVEIHESNKIMAYDFFNVSSTFRAVESRALLGIIKSVSQSWNHEMNLNGYFSNNSGAYSFVGLYEVYHRGGITGIVSREKRHPFSFNSPSNNTFTLGSGIAITQEIEKDITQLESVYVDNTLLIQNVHYSVATGSTFTLFPNFLDTLDEGVHIMKILFIDDDNIESHFNVLGEVEDIEFAEIMQITSIYLNDVELLPNLHYDPETYEIYESHINTLPNGTYALKIVFNDGSIIEELILIQNSTGINVSGIIKSYNPNNQATIKLMQGNEVKYTEVINAATGSGQIEQPFTIEGVEPGTYTLIVTKPGHLCYTKLALEVGTDSINLDEITLIPGDINGDGQINVNDLFIFIDNYRKSDTEIINPLADINGDGQVNVNDLFLFIDGYRMSDTVVP